MSSTTPMVTTLESIDGSLLANVSGGCHHGSSPTIINNNVAPPAPAPQIAPQAPMPPSVQTSVSINGQPAA